MICDYTLKRGERGFDEALEKAIGKADCILGLRDRRAFDSFLKERTASVSESAGSIVFGLGGRDVRLSFRSNRKWFLRISGISSEIELDVASVVSLRLCRGRLVVGTCPNPLYKVEQVYAGIGVDGLLRSFIDDYGSVDRKSVNQVRSALKKYAKDRKAYSLIEGRSTSKRLLFVLGPGYGIQYGRYVRKEKRDV